MGEGVVRCQNDKQAVSRLVNLHTRSMQTQRGGCLIFQHTQKRDLHTQPSQEHPLSDLRHEPFVVRSGSTPCFVVNLGEAARAHRHRNLSGSKNSVCVCASKTARACIVEKKNTIRVARHACQAPNRRLGEWKSRDTVSTGPVALPGIAAERVQSVARVITAPARISCAIHQTSLFYLPLNNNANAHP